MPFHQLFAQLTFATALRTPWIQVELEDRLFELFRQGCQERQCVPVAVGGMPDHVHLLVDLPPTVAIDALAQGLLAAGAELMREALGPKTPFQWQDGYGALTLRANEVGTVARYIRRQKELHLQGKLSVALERTS